MEENVLPGEECIKSKIPNKQSNMFEQSEIFSEKLNDVENYPIYNEKPLDDPEEYQHLREICASFINYQVDSLKDVARMERDFSRLPVEHLKLLKNNYKERLSNLRYAIGKNYSLLLKIISPYSHMFKFFKGNNNEILFEPLKVAPKDVVKMRSTLKLFIRDWTKEGEFERNQCHKVILEDFKNIFSSNKTHTGEHINVLLPGVGLGRLLYEFAKLGFKAQGNEFSYFMLIASNFILNCTTMKEEFEIQPLIHSFSNVFWEEAPFKSFKIPDENLLEELNKNPEGEMSMVAGEFVEVYKKQYQTWYSVVTCFFIDTANNIIEYIETIHKILKIGGVWINFGPLLYHYSEIEKECSIELSWDELKHMIIKIGFDITKEEIKESVYSSDNDSMLKTIYRNIYFVAVKIQ